MRIALFCHSLLSDWNHGNAHFLRGVGSELLSRGHQVRVLEARDAWSVTNLVAEEGPGALSLARSAYPWLDPVRYETGRLDLDYALDGVDLAIVHEWTPPELVRRIGAHRAAARTGYGLLFHDTHHRSVSDPAFLGELDLSGYDGVLAFGHALRDRYLEGGLAARAWTWHEAADVRVFFPRGREGPPDGDLVWIGNWGDGDRARDLDEFLLGPVRALRLRAQVYGVRYPEEGRAALVEAGIRTGGWLPNFRVPEVFARHRVTVHVPRRPYVDTLPGIPTIRPFEALACGIPLVCAPWNDTDGLFTVGSDFLMARDGEEMTRHLRALLHDPTLARSLAERGRRTILERHTCAHRVDELLSICAELGVGGATRE